MIRGFLRILGPQRGLMFGYLAWVSAYGLLHGIAMVLLVPISQALFDGRYGDAARWLGVLAVVVVAAAVAQYVQSSRAMRMALATMRLLHHRLGDHMVTLPLGWFTRDTVGSVSQIAVKGTTFVGTSGAHLITPIVLNIVSAATVVAGLALFDWRIAVVALVGGLVLVGCGRLASRLIAEAETLNHAAEVEVNTRVVEFARCQPVLRAFGRTGADFAPLGAALEAQHTVGRRALWRSVAGLMVNGVAVQAVFSVLIAAAAWLAVDGATGNGGGQLNPITAVAILGLAARFASPLAALAEYGSAMRMARTELDRITAILDTPALPEPDVPQQVSTPGRVELEHVAFGYPGRSVATDISFVAEPGTMTALVGPSGSGKTTLTRLIARFYDTDAGVVRVGGVDVRDQRTADLMAQLSLVFQDVYLFDDTLWENVRIGRPDATEAEIAAAAQTAGLTAVLDRLPEGWQTRVGEGGSALSGGERQRVSIARALLKDAPIVLFDEATSALDPENERHVADAIRTLAQRSTVVVIAHKLSTVTAADQIVVLSGAGTVADCGTHTDLMARGGQYADFWSQRVSASGWSMADKVG
ncbi:ABC transporter ATPase/permease [Mycolicibacterium canariasense]|uniref:ABC transporter ATPase/permease n=1 Tax=Mycolicibacterium canariasense TaxID=228230 RepID=A0A124E1L6_MYCCR|nr:ABC transporter ATP-binding protein [Mycolicibacterium canariasense]MCV7210262.1 ABC transporter ATP-binding protein [Mycolicibacterium canariasense]ORV04439.1 ABC transporter [Mycolicibacterium canariasense]GAS94053.1 ABC transporter ATPase/permease [Mycolicibacterium canariasense]